MQARPSPLYRCACGHAGQHIHKKNPTISTGKPSVNYCRCRMVPCGFARYSISVQSQTLHKATFNRPEKLLFEYRSICAALQHRLFALGARAMVCSCVFATAHTGACVRSMFAASSAARCGRLHKKIRLFETDRQSSLLFPSQ